MTDFLLELLSEEIPARMQDKAQADLARMFGDELAKAGLKAEGLTTYATPRRLTLIARGLPLETAAVSEETKGPKVGAPPQALEGFLRKTGLTQDQLVERDGVYFAVVDKPGRATASVIAEAIPAIVRAFPWPKSMRWGKASASTASLRWVRPLQGIVALLGDDVVEFEIDGVVSGAATVGHRFHHSGPITIGNADDYAAKLRACHVIVDPAERRDIIRARAEALAAEAGMTLVPDEGLVAENAGLTEWPVPLLGRFDASFLEVPREVIQLTLRTNQKYFVLNDAAGALAPAFICTANIEAKDGGVAITAGNGKVLAARLSDAKFFWEQDLKTKLEDQLPKLQDIVFHEKLGTVADKVERVAKLARWLVESGVVTDKPLPAKGGVGVGQSASDHSAAGVTHPPAPSLGREGELADLAEQAARLAKADLVTGMVGEFPELQGVMGGYYARAEGLPNAVADAIRDHYKPVGQGDEVPTAPVTVAVSLADKLDTLSSFFAAQLRPTGSKDPFALRRAALGVLLLVVGGGLRLRIMRLADVANDNTENFLASLWQPQTGVGLATMGMRGTQLAPVGEGHPAFAYDLLDFFADRLKVQQREAGVRHDLIDAVFALGGEDDLVRLLARVKALQAFVETEDGRNLLAGYKRAANILKKEAPTLSAAGEEDPGAALEDPLVAEGIRAHEAYDMEPAEAALVAALADAEPRAKAAVEAEDFAAAMTALASLRAPIDGFFENVTVNDPLAHKRKARLAILEQIRAAMHNVADFSRIEG
ncbi:glycine--tRNA ligase subunit beta [Sphingomonas crocodyli]|uniref:Glycine--tRNA ligase beta subunit n=1 Tax=Sphingomonas crocodyli TaxID=1979270 RepID=A0A437LVJ8_9SPHN|nr:glycine--tRNA ligase subunit beta [Sphingomonas crocodyli]RVT89429.1 glycine--tRNA ligase subunit beta [Sphingomonas crocodyli]